MEGTSGGVAAGEGGKNQKKPPNKRENNVTSNKGKSPAAKRRRVSQAIRRRNSKFRSLGGSLSDPLNLEAWSDNNESTSTPALVDRDRHLGDQSRLPLPRELHDDPLNLEGKITDFQTLVDNFKQIPHPLGKNRNSITNNYRDKRKRKRRMRKKSRSESSASISDAGPLNHASSSTPSADKPSKNSKSALYRYGNYDRYYGYRNNGSLKDDPRVALLDKKWFMGKDCLDIGSNTGQVTMGIAKAYSPNSITGVDIDSKLVRLAQKNLQQILVPSKMPDGRSVPKSILMSFGPVEWLLKEGGARNEGKYPKNVNFIQDNYVPFSDESLLSTTPEYDVILCFSVTKWIHLNWGDEALKRTFKKMYRNLRVNGRLVLEPQPWSSYGKRKKINAELFENYQNIKFFPDQFHKYLLSSEVGFTDHQYLGLSDNRSLGFQRPIHVYLKRALPTEKSHPFRELSIDTKSADASLVKPHPPSGGQSTSLKDDIGKPDDCEC